MLITRRCKSTTGRVGLGIKVGPGETQFWANNKIFIRPKFSQAAEIFDRPRHTHNYSQSALDYMPLYTIQFNIYNIHVMGNIEERRQEERRFPRRRCSDLPCAGRWNAATYTTSNSSAPRDSMARRRRRSEHPSRSRSCYNYYNLII